MKTSLALIPALCLLAMAAPAAAHPGHASEGYLVFWKGVPPKSGAGLRGLASSSGFWRMAFVSKFPIIGSPLSAEQ